MTIRESGQLRGLLGYQLQRINLQFGEECRRALAEFEITPARVAAMMLIRDEAGCDQSTLGRALSVNRASAMKIVNALAARGFVERLPGRDLRSNALHLTAHGERILERMIGTLTEREKIFTAALSDEERQALLRTLHKLRTPALHD